MELKGKKINFLGDSITEGCGATSTEKTFWGLLQTKEGCISRGYGISGTRFAKQLNEDEEGFNAYFRTRVEKMDADADAIVVFGGTNDYGHGNAPIGVFEDRTDETFFGALHNLCESLINKYPEAQLVFMTPLHRISENRDINELGLRNVYSLSEYVEAIKKVAAYYSIPVLDLYSVSGMQPEVEIIKQKYMPDGLHPNDAGHELIYKKLVGFLKLI